MTDPNAIDIVGSTDTSDQAIGQFGPSGPPSYINEYIPIFTIDTGMQDLLGADLLHWLGANVPMIDYPADQYGGNFLTFDSPNLSVPGYGSFDLKARMGFDIDLGAYLHYQYDFGKLTASATVTAPRVDGERAFGVYRLDTSTTTVTATVNALAGTEPFVIDITVAGSQTDANGVPLPGSLQAGILGAGVYRDGSPYKGLVFDIGFDESGINAVYPLAGPVQQGETIGSFNAGYLSGYLNVPQLPSLVVTAGGTGAAALDGQNTGGGDGPTFGNLTFRPIGLVPVIGTINYGHFDIIRSPVVDAGLDYTLIGLDIRLEALLHQTLTVDLKSVNVHAEAWEDIREDRPVDGDRSALDTDGDFFVKVSEASGVLGDVLSLGNFKPGERDNTRIDEFYSITLRVNSDIDLLLRGGVDFSFLTLSAFINPIFIDELRLNVGPLFATSFNLDIAAIDIFTGGFDITFTTPAKVTNYIRTIVEISGTPGDDTGLDELRLVTGQVHVDGLAGNDSITGNGLNNVLEGSEGNDTVFGQGGNDTIRGGAGRDSLDGGFGNDVIEVGRFGFGAEYARGWYNDDLIVVEGASGTFLGDWGNDTIRVDLGNDQVLDGGDGTDLLDIDATSFSFSFNLDFALGGAIFGSFNGTSFANFEQISFRAGTGNDVLRGTALGDTLAGGAGNDSIDGRLGHDVLEGGDGNDTLLGGEHYDTLRGGAGNDSLDGGTGIDSLFGDDGDDTIDGGGGSDVIHGGAGNDSIADALGSNQIYGGQGDDTVIASGAGSRVRGDGGNDSLTGVTGTMTIEGGTGRDLIVAEKGMTGLVRGDEGSDTISVWGNGLALTVEGDNPDVTEGATLFSAAPMDVLKVRAFTSATSPGGPVYSPFVTLPAALTVLGASGTLGNGTSWSGIEAFDIEASLNADYLQTGDGDDRLVGLSGADYLDGGAGRDSLDGGTGNDTLVGGFGDSFIGGAGIDLLIFTAQGLPAPARAVSLGFELNLGNVSARGTGSGSPDGFLPEIGAATREGTASFGTVLRDVEQLMMTGSGAGDDTITGAERADTILGGAGDDSLDGGAGNDEIEGGTGSDTIFGGAGDDLIGATGADTAPGTEGGDELYGNGGNDTIIGNAHASLLSGGAGNDALILAEGGAIPGRGVQTTVDGGEGSDGIEGSSRDDLLIGGVDPIDDPTEDFVRGGLRDSALAAYDGADTIFGYGGHDEIIGGTGNDSLDGGTGNDTLRGGSGADTLEGGAGNDSILGGSGHDSLGGGADNDTIDAGTGNDLATGGAGDDSLSGGDGNDSLFGNDGNDALNGGLGNDSLVGGAGVDLLEGGEGADSLHGGADYDTLYGGTGNDTLEGGSGGDIIHGDDGNDAISDVNADDPGTLFGDELYGGAGNDTISANRHLALADGGAGNDSIRVFDSGTPADGAGAITIAGGAGGDNLYGSAASEAIFGGDAGGGVDGVVDTGGGIGVDGLPPGSGPDGADVIEAGGGEDTVRAGDGNDTVLAGDGNDFVQGGAGNDSIDGGDGGDDLSGDDGNDTITGGANGEDIGDTIFGGAGNDVLTGSDGLDYIDGGSGNDTIDGGLANALSPGLDTLLGGDGADLITADGAATIDGGSGNDTIVANDGGQEMVFDAINGAFGHDVVRGFTPGEDKLRFNGAMLDPAAMVLTDTVDGLRITFGTGTAGSVLLQGVLAADLGPGDLAFTGPPIGRNDVIYLTAGLPAQIAADVLLANDLGGNRAMTGVFSFNVSASLTGTVVDIAAGTSPGIFGYYLGNADGSSFANVVVDYLVTTAGSDVLTVPATGSGLPTSGSYIDLQDGHDLLTGSVGRDHVLGGAGNDTIGGGPGDDTLLGGDGDDSLNGGAGNDSLEGGAGNDRLLDNSGVNTLAGGAGNDTYFVQSTDLATIGESLNQGVDTVFSNGRLVLGLNLENGTLLGTTGAELTGNGLANILNGNSGDDTISGNGGADRLFGKEGADLIDGGSGNDTLEGGVGADTITGGTGADRFVFRAADLGSTDRIADFSAADGDRIDLLAIDANANVTGNQAFAMVLRGFTGNAGELLIVPTGAAADEYSVQGDVDGDGLADFSLIVSSPTALSAADFFL